MFDGSSVFILAEDGRIYRLEVDRDAQDAICETFASSVKSMFKGKNTHPFEINYKPEDDELLCIEHFSIPDDIRIAIRNPMGVDAYKKNPDVVSERNDDFTGFPKIKAIFVGERIQRDEKEYFNIGFQRFRKEQNFIALPVRLFYSNETFQREKNFGIGIAYKLDCYYTKDELQFSSFYLARQVFDLREYYRLASDLEVMEFTQNEALSFENASNFSSIVNMYVRRKIAIINDSEVLKKYTTKQIKKIARISGIDVNLKDGRILIPANKELAVEILAFLDEEAYRGPFSNDLLIANSKRVLRKA